MKDRYKVLQELCYEANMEIPAHQLALFTWGNVSSFDEDLGVFAIKPSGVPYSELTVDNMVVVDLEGNTVYGSLKPSSDMHTHRVLYRSFKGIYGITHTHSPYACAWAQARVEVPILGTTHADHTHKNIPITAMMSEEQVKGNYEEETGLMIVEAFKGRNPLEEQMVLVAGHGPFTFGKNALSSVYNAVVLEEVCKMAYMTSLINPAIGPLPSYLCDKHYQRKHGKDAYYGQ
ncbi:MAG: L-ribulose-5-phosphate 4-epimerase AraD [Spirochaetia bacterium]|nr:L-ribulose-5-phosphate 4-epimerase AraD [Spirochaetia bacterium]